MSYFPQATKFQKRFSNVISIFFVLRCFQVGMATNIPPHNLGELVDALSALIHNPEATVDIYILRHAHGLWIYPLASFFL